MAWPRPVPLVGDQTSSAERRAHPAAWAFPDGERSAFYGVVAARRDVRRFRPDPVPEELLERVLSAGHAAPSVGHSQPWRFVVVRDDTVRAEAALMADRERLAQAAVMDPDAGRRLLDLQLEGIREAPLGVVVACDRRVPALGVLGRATFPDADLWSCACAVQNIWLAARAEGLGLGWVTLFRPEALAGLLRLPPGVDTLGWLCLGWPDERPPGPGLERAGWSHRQPLSSVVMADRWAERPVPVSHLAPPSRAAVVSARDDADRMLTPPGSLGALDRAVDRVVACAGATVSGGRLVLVAGRHPVTRHGVSAFGDGVTDDVLGAARAGSALGVVAARGAGLSTTVEDAGSSTGDLVGDDALTATRRDELLARGRALGRVAAADGLVVLGEVGVGNTTVAAALACALLGLTPEAAVGLGSGADTQMLARKREVTGLALDRCRGRDLTDPLEALLAVGGPEFAVLAGVVVGAAGAGSVVVLDGLATSVAALCAVLVEPAAAQHLVAGQRSRELAHGAVLARLGLEPLLDLRIRAGEGAGASLAAGLLLAALRVRRETARTL